MGEWVVGWIVIKGIYSYMKERVIVIGYYLCHKGGSFMKYKLVLNGKTSPASLPF